MIYRYTYIMYLFINTFIGDSNAAGLAALVPAFRRMPRLERLDLSGSAFMPSPEQGAAFAERLLEALPALQGLKVLIVAYLLAART